MIRDQRRRPVIGGRFGHLLRRCSVPVVPRRGFVEGDRRAADIGDANGPSVVLELEKIRERARRVPRHGHDSDRGVADTEHLPVGADHVAFRMAARTRLDRVPVLGAVHEVHAQHLILKISRASVMVGVRVRHHRVLHRVDVEAELLQPAGDLVGHGVFEERLDDDDAVAAGQRP